MSSPEAQYVLGLHGGDVDEFKMLLAAKLSCHLSELLCDPDQPQIQVELCRERYYPVPKRQSCEVTKYKCMLVVYTLLE